MADTENSGAGRAELAATVAEAIRAACPTDEQCLPTETECYARHPVHSEVEQGGRITRVTADVDGLAQIIASTVAAASIRPPAGEGARGDTDEVEIARELIAEHVPAPQPIVGKVFGGPYGLAHVDRGASFQHDEINCKCWHRPTNDPAPMATHSPDDGQEGAVEFSTVWGVRLPGDPWVLGTTRDEAKARQALTQWRTEREEAGEEGPEPELIRRLVSEWEPADVIGPATTEETPEADR